jgi:FemAB-related protein (PEP-CTERM system-associated)
LNISLTGDTSLANFIESQAPGTFSHIRTWLSVVPQLYGYKVFLLSATNKEGRIAGFLPVCLIRSLLTGPRLVSLPFTDQCPLLAADEASANQLIDQAIQLAQHQKVRYLELRTGVNDVVARRADLVEGNLYVTWLLKLSTDPERMWKELRKPVQRQIKKSEGQGVSVRLARRREDMEHYYRLHLQTRCRKHGMPAQPRAYFYSLWDAFATQGGVRLLLAEFEGRVIAGMILLASGTTIRYAYGASDEHYLKLAPNNLLLWTAIKIGCAAGFQNLDLGRTARDNEGLMAFKRRWGGIQEPLPYYYYPQMAGLATTSETSHKFRLLTACWKRLPVQIAGPVGGVLYKHLG